MFPQELYTASGEWVSRYKSKQAGPAVDARTFSTDCFKADLTTFKTQANETGVDEGPTYSIHSDGTTSDESMTNDSRSSSEEGSSSDESDLV